jgi:hypothetical protein
LQQLETLSLTLKEEHRLRVFENRVLKTILGRKMDEVTEEWRKLHSEVLRCLYLSPDMIRLIKSRRIMWAGMWHSWEWRGKCTWFWWEIPNERDLLEDQGIDKRMGLEWILGRLAGGV